MVDRIEVPLSIDGFEVTGSEVVAGQLQVDVVSTRRQACHHCGSLDAIGHGRRRRVIRDRACAYPTVLRWSQRRFKCRDCERTYQERHPEICGRRAVTRRFRRHLYKRAVIQPFTHVAATENVSPYRVIEAFDWHSLEDVKMPLRSTPQVISIDESAFKRRWRYHTVLSAPLDDGVFELIDGRERADVEASLLALSPQVRAGIRAVVVDLFWPYAKAVESALPDAAIVADKFHVLAAIGRASTDVRRRCGLRDIPISKRTGRPLHRRQFRRFDPEVLATKWTFVKRCSKLSAAERARLDRLFERFPEIGVGWLMRETFAAIYDSSDRQEAERRLEHWESHLAVAGLPELNRCWRSVSGWREAILAYFDWPFTNAFAEGITNKIKVVKRCAYGFTNKERYRRKVLLACGRRIG
ncbi:MAG: ISL3 family transposase [Gammaproteobacteria bacterium]